MMHRPGSLKNGPPKRYNSGNPYRKPLGAVSKPLLLATLLVTGLTWLIISLHLFSTQSSVPSHPGLSALRKDKEQRLAAPADLDIRLPQVEPREESPKDRKDSPGRSEKDEKKRQDNNKRKPRKKDTNDYRNIVIETPPPKDHVISDLRGIQKQAEELAAANPVYRGREKLVKMLLEMYINVTQIDDSVWEQVPVWDDIVKVHGSHPVIYGLDSCEQFRNSVDPMDRRVGIAGMFNTGTNLLAILLQHNCAIPERIKKMGRKKGHGMEWQVPWGKHTPAWYRGEAHVKNFIGQIKPEHLMVAVMVRNPHDWMASMCRHGYTAKWKRTAKNCPNLYEGNSVHAKFGPGPSDHASLAHMWNDWNGVYFNASFPRVMVRFEDTIFFPKEVSKKVCSCVGGKLITPKENDGIFHYVIDSAKTGPGHGPGKKRNGLIDAWIKYGRAREVKLSKSDLEFSEKYLNRDIVQALSWGFPPIPAEDAPKS